MKQSLSHLNFRGVSWPWAIVAFCLAGMAVIFSLPELAFFRELKGHYLPVHMVLEFSAIFVSFAIFFLGWLTFRTVAKTSILFLSVTGLSVGMLDFAHTLSFAGMPDFVTPSGPNKAIYFWLASRWTDVLAVLGIAFFYEREFRYPRFAPIIMTAGLVWTAAWYALILFQLDSLPPMFSTQTGLTSLKLGLEWAAIAISLLAAGVFLWRARLREDPMLHWLAAAAVISAGTGFFFTQYRAVDDLYNLSGHVYKTISFAMIFYVVFTECISKPYEDLRKLAQTTAEANEAKVRFLANVSHEFRTPLGVISGFGGLLLASQSLRPEERQWAGTIEKNASQLRALIDDLLDLAKVETGKIMTRWVRFPVSEVIDDVVAGLELLAQQKRIGLHVSYDPDTPQSINSDPLRLRQILVNLIGNAIKFTERGEVRVRIRPDGPGGLLIAITDTGIGIDPAAVGRLFRPFSQVDDALTRRFGGTGLGLALSRKLAGLLGGELWLENTEPGQGSTFMVTVASQSAADLAPKVSKDAVKPVTAPRLSGVSILAAEDCMDNQDLLSLYLKSTGADLELVLNGLEAVELSARRDFHVILMDIQMPEMDGYQATARIRGAGWDGPIIALSAHAQKGDRERAMREGFTDYIVKPFTKEQLWDALVRHVNGSS